MLSDALGKSKWTWLVLVLSATLTATLGSSQGLHAAPIAAAQDDDPAPPPGAPDEQGDEKPEPAPTVADDDDRGPAEEAPPAAPGEEEKPTTDDPPQGAGSENNTGEDEPADEATADEDQEPVNSEEPTRGPTPAVRPGAGDTPGQLPEAQENGRPSPIKHGSETIEAAPDQMAPAALNGVCPGQTTRDELHRAWGDPKRVDKVAGALRETYEINALGRVRVTIVEDVVDSLAINLPAPLSVAQAAKRLQLEDFEAVEVLNDQGRIVGQAYPERGVMFGFEQKSNPPGVFQIVIEPVDAQAFLDRAAARMESRFADCLEDLKRALEIAPDAVRAHWLHAELTLRAGDFEQALQSAEKTVQLAPDELEYRLTLAKVQAATGDYTEAMKNAGLVAAKKEAAPVLAAGAHLLWGDYLAACEKHDYEQAMRKHTQAIKLAEPFIASPKFSERRAAKEVMLDAHLAVAHDIGWGRWQQKAKVVPKWIERAAVFADDLMAHEQASPLLQFRVHEQALAALAGINQPPDESTWLRGLSELGQKLYDQSTDPPFQAHLAWRMGVALSDAVEIEATRLKLDRALAWGTRALECFDKGEEAGKQLAAHDYLRGRLCYRLGAIFAVQKSEHERAIAWYDRAVPLLESPVPPATVDCGKQGETFVSIAVSYWETNNRREALRLTNEGVKLMEQAAHDGLLEKSALAVPYSNLASMHEQLGDVQEARKYSELASRHESKR